MLVHGVFKKGSDEVTAAIQDPPTLGLGVHKPANACHDMRVMDIFF